MFAIYFRTKKSMYDACINLRVQRVREWVKMRLRISTLRIVHFRRILSATRVQSLFNNWRNYLIFFPTKVDDWSSWISVIRIRACEGRDSRLMNLRKIYQLDWWWFLWRVIIYLLLVDESCPIRKIIFWLTSLFIATMISCHRFLLFFCE